MAWYKLAAQHGYSVAQNNLGYMYEHGQDEPRILCWAYKWYNLASAQGDENATTNKAMLKKEMTNEKIAEGQKLSSEFVAVKE